MTSANEEDEDLLEAGCVPLPVTCFYCGAKVIKSGRCPGGCGYSY